LAKQMSGRDVKIVTTLHGTDITVLGYDSSLADSIRFGIEKSDVVTAVSESLVKQTYDLIGPEKDIKTVYNFIDERVYRKIDSSHLKKEFAISPEDKVVIHVSNFRTVKRVTDVVKAFKGISDKMPATLLLVGDGPEMAKVCKLVDELNIKAKVRFLGKQENLEELYSISDLMLLLSEKESFGLVALEAMACGVPCVGTNIGGIPEVIVDGETGLICELGNIAEIAEKSVALLLDENKLQQFSANSVTRVMDHFRGETIVSQYEKIYEELILAGEYI